MEATTAAQEISVKKYVVRLSADERERLEALMRKGKSPAQRLVKARILLKADISEVGGFTGILQVAAAAFQRGKRVITHGYKTNIEIAANLHFLAAQEKEEILEYSLSHSPLRWAAPIWGVKSRDAPFDSGISA